MAIFDVFKKKKKEHEKPQKKEKPKAEKRPVKKEAKKPAVVPSKPKKVSGSSYRVLRAPQVTEKATDLLEKNQYIFKVFPDANKTEIKKTIESAYGVDVEAVRIINIPRKKRRLGRVEGWQEGYKKAIVKIREGQKIEILPR